MWTKLVIPQVIELLPHARKLLDEYLASRKQTRGLTPARPRTIEGASPDAFTMLMAEHVALQQVADAQSAAIERLSAQMNDMHATVVQLERAVAAQTTRANRLGFLAAVALLLAAVAAALPLLHHAH